MLTSTRRPNILVKALLGVLVFFTLGTGVLLFLLYRGGGSQESVDILIPRKSSMAAVAEKLRGEGIIHNPSLFKALLRFTGGAQKLRAGEFRFRKNMRLIDALFVLYYDSPILHSITVPEGWNARQIAAALAKSGLGNEQKYLSIMFSKEWTQKYKLNTPSLEGFLFPDTYAFSKIDSEEKIVDHMVQSFFKKFDPALQEEAKRKGFSLEQIVTLASIVEKETGSGSERELVSSVFHNRLKKKMRLQSDPTIIYGIPDFDGDIRTRDIHRPTPYNTYVISGLPPGPIASPSLASLIAAVRPAETKYLYFVSNNQGGHIFSETYEQHLRLVNNYQRRGVGNRQPKSSERKPAASPRKKKKRR